MGRRVLTNSDPLCEVVVIMKSDGSAQAVVMSNNLPQTTVTIPPPGDGERIVVKRTPDGCVDVFYEDEP